MTHPRIRTARADDAREIATLLTTLGHPTSAGELAARWDAWNAEGNSALVAVRENGTLAAVVTLHRMHVLHRPLPVGRITALVVAEDLRGRGIGRALVAAAEAVLRDAGCGPLEVTSNKKRLDAHAFYRQLGYEETSVRFAKDLRPAPSPPVAWIQNRSMPMATVVPVLPCRDVRREVEWLVRAFGFRERLRIATHRAQIEVGTGAVVIAESEAPFPAAIMVRVAEVDPMHERALRAGAEIPAPPQDHPYGERQCTIRDPEGHLWTFSQSVANVDPASFGAVVPERP